MGSTAGAGAGAGHHGGVLGLEVCRVVGGQRRSGGRQPGTRTSQSGRGPTGRRVQRTCCRVRAGKGGRDGGRGKCRRAGQDEPWARRPQSQQMRLPKEGTWPCFSFGGATRCGGSSSSKGEELLDAREPASCLFHAHAKTRREAGVQRLSRSKQEVCLANDKKTEAWGSRFGRVAKLLSQLKKDVSLQMQPDRWIAAVHDTERSTPLLSKPKPKATTHANVVQYSFSFVCLFLLVMLSRPHPPRHHHS